MSRLMQLAKDGSRAVFFAALAAGLAFGQSDTSPIKLSEVSGVVTDEIGAVIRGAEVVFQSDSGTITTHTDENGRATLRLESGDYTVTIRAPHFTTTQLRNLKVQAPNSAFFTVTLSVAMECDHCGMLLPSLDLQPQTVALPYTLLAERLSPTDVDRMKRFTGTWETRKSLVTHKSNITITLARGTDSLTGKIRFVNPDLSETEVKVISAKMEKYALAFQTSDGFLWRLSANQASNIATLTGSQHEILIKEKVTKQR